MDEAAGFKAGVGDVAASATGDADFGEGRSGGFEEGDAGFGVGFGTGDRGEVSGGSSSDDDDFHGWFGGLGGDRLMTIG